MLALYVSECQRAGEIRSGREGVKARQCRCGRGEGVTICSHFVLALMTQVRYKKTARSKGERAVRRLVGQMEAIRFEHGLSALVHHDTLSILGHLALAELAGVSGLADGWLRERLDSEPGNKVWIRWFGQKSSDEIASLWGALRQGGSREIMNSARAAVRKPQDQSGLSLAFDSIVVQLVLLGLGAVV